MSDSIWYEEVPAIYVDLKVRQAAINMLQFCFYDLNLKKVNVKWFREYGLYGTGRGYSASLFKHPRQICGLAIRKDELIWINVDMPSREIISTIAHECRHMYQWASMSLRNK